MLNLPIPLQPSPAALHLPVPAFAFPGFFHKFAFMLTITKASAGSGKTFALTREYIKLLLLEKGPHASWRLRPDSAFRGEGPHSHILAVTFTNKATQEMSSRIIGELELLSDPSRNAQSRYLSFFTGLGIDPEALAHTSRLALANLLMNYSLFNVSTIDSFFQRVLNAFARELDIPPLHNIELSDDYPLAVAVGAMLQWINRDIPGGNANPEVRRQKKVVRWLKKYMVHLLREGDNAQLFSKSSRVNSAMISTFTRFHTEQFKINRHRIQQYFSEPDRLNRFAASLAKGGPMRKPLDDARAEACRLYATIADSGIGSANLRSMIAKLADPTADPGAVIDSATFRKAISDPSACFNKGQSPSAELLESIRQTSQHFCDAAMLAETAKKISEHIYLLGLFAEMHHFLDEYRQTTDTLLLSDTNDLLKRIISHDETPFIYEKLGQQLRHFLIDEFQDTSAMQWENFSPLVLESLANGNDSLIIGDEKQCIYRFRNSDPEIMGSRVEAEAESWRSGCTRVLGVKVEENSNWRSSPDIVRFNNTLFHFIARDLPQDAARTIARTYSSLVQGINPDRHIFPGYISIVAKPEYKPGKARKAPNATDGAGGSESPLTAGPAGPDALLTDMIREIDRQLKAGYRPKDIGVLVRKRHEGARAIEAILSAQQQDWWTHGPVPVMSADSMSIDRSGAVRIVINILRMLGDPVTSPKRTASPTRAEDAAYRRYRLIHRFELCRYAEVPATDPEGNPLLDGQGHPVMRRLTDSEALEEALGDTADNPGFFPGERSEQIKKQIDKNLFVLRSMQCTSLVELTERVIHRFLTDAIRTEQASYIAAFQDIVFDFADRGSNSIREFLDYWDTTAHSTSLDAPDGLDAISVMTIHKAKGLEFKCVHLPYCSYEMNGSSKKQKSYHWYHLAPSFFPFSDPEDVPPLMPLPIVSANNKIPVLNDETVAWEVEQRTDGLNLAYVAFTRAVCELNVYLDEWEAPKKDSASEPKFSVRLVNALQSVTDEAIAAEAANGMLSPEALPWVGELASHFLPGENGEGICYTIGSPTVPEPEKDKKPADHTLSDEFPDLTEGYEVSALSRLKMEVDFRTRAVDLDNPRDVGIYYHAILSAVRRPADLWKAVERQSRGLKVTDPQVKARAYEILSKALESPEVAPWFTGYKRIITEREICSGTDIQRPDRVVVMPDGSTVVIDYKFYHDPDRSDINRNKRQLNRYIALLRSLGFHNVSGRLWYIFSNEILPV